MKKMTQKKLLEKAMKRINETFNVPKFDFSGIKTLEELKADGYNITAVSSGSDGKVNSFIATKNGRKIYGYYHAVHGKYYEEPVKR